MDVEFKSTVKALDSSDLVAFANSASGGAILFGVQESSDSDGRQIAEVVGCQISDEAKLRLVAKAMACQPPIQIEIFAENTSDVPFYRVEIPSGDLKPYCTGGGTYKIRQDGRVHALSPTELLETFLVREAAEFRRRFQEVTQGMLESLRKTAASVEDVGDAISSDLSALARKRGWV